AGPAQDGPAMADRTAKLEISGRWTEGMGAEPLTRFTRPPRRPDQGDTWPGWAFAARIQSAGHRAPPAPGSHVPVGGWDRGRAEAGCSHPPFSRGAAAAGVDPRFPLVRRSPAGSGVRRVAHRARIRVCSSHGGAVTAVCTVTAVMLKGCASVLASRLRAGRGGCSHLSGRNQLRTAI